MTIVGDISCDKAHKDIIHTEIIKDTARYWIDFRWALTIFVIFR